jgi:hypothetical protein
MRRPAYFLACALVATLATHAADIYRWKDANGVWHYSDQPVAGAERVGSSSQAARPAAPRGTPAEQDPPSATDTATLRKVRDDVAADKAARCKDAQANYQQTVESRRLYRPGPDGERIFLDEAEIEAARVTARANMEYYCGK